MLLLIDVLMSDVEELVLVESKRVSVFFQERGRSSVLFKGICGENRGKGSILVRTGLGVVCLEIGVILVDEAIVLFECEV